MDKNSEQNREPETSPTQQVTRRYFLKGTTLALPAVVTLHSGTALANTSAGCGGQALTSNAVSPVTGAADDYMREQVTCYGEITITLKSGNLSMIRIDTNNPEGQYFQGTRGYFQGKQGLPLVTSDTPLVWRNKDGSLVTDARKIAILDRLLKPLDDNKRITITVPPSTTPETYKVYGADSFNKGPGFALINLNTDGDPVSVGAPAGEQSTFITSLTGACLASLLRSR